MNLQDISLGRHAPSIINVVIEAPKGSKKKYRYHAKSGRFRLAYEFSMPVPTEYGWIPETTAEDGHFLNAMVIARNSSHPGYVCEARPIGILKRKDRDHHVICVLLGDERYASVKDISDLDVKLLKKIVQFFEPYFELSGWLNHTETVEVITGAHEKYIAKRKPHDAEDFDENLEEANEVEENSEWDDEYDQGEEEDANSNN
jgi:inorganic pyrophosphatase